MINLHYFEKQDEWLDHTPMEQNDFHHIISSHFHDEFYPQDVYNMMLMFHEGYYKLNIVLVDEYVSHRHVRPK